MKKANTAEVKDGYGFKIRMSKTTREAIHLEARKQAYKLNCPYTATDLIREILESKFGA